MIMKKFTWIVFFSQLILSTFEAPMMKLGVKKPRFLSTDLSEIDPNLAEDSVSIVGENSNQHLSQSGVNWRKYGRCINKAHKLSMNENGLDDGGDGSVTNRNTIVDDGDARDHMGTVGTFAAKRGKHASAIRKSRDVLAVLDGDRSLPSATEFSWNPSSGVNKAIGPLEAKMLSPDDQFDDYEYVELKRVALDELGIDTTNNNLNVGDSPVGRQMGKAAVSSVQLQGNNAGVSNPYMHSIPSPQDSVKHSRITRAMPIEMPSVDRARVKAPDYKQNDTTFPLDRNEFSHSVATISYFTEQNKPAALQDEEGGEENHGHNPAVDFTNQVREALEGVSLDTPDSGIPVVASDAGWQSSDTNQQQVSIDDYPEQSQMGGSMASSHNVVPRADSLLSDGMQEVGITSNEEKRDIHANADTDIATNDLEAEEESIDEQNEDFGLQEYSDDEEDEHNDDVSFAEISKESPVDDSSAFVKQSPKSRGIRDRVVGITYYGIPRSVLPNDDNAIDVKDNKSDDKYHYNSASVKNNIMFDCHCSDATDNVMFRSASSDGRHINDVYGQDDGGDERGDEEDNEASFVDLNQNVFGKFLMATTDRGKRIHSLLAGDKTNNVEEEEGDDEAVSGNEHDSNLDEKCNSVVEDSMAATDRRLPFLWRQSNDDDTKEKDVAEQDDEDDDDTSFAWESLVKRPSVSTRSEIPLSVSFSGGGLVDDESLDTPDDEDGITAVSQNERDSSAVTERDHTHVTLAVIKDDDHNAKDDEEDGQDDEDNEGEASSFDGEQHTSLENLHSDVTASEMSPQDKKDETGYEEDTNHGEKSNDSTSKEEMIDDEDNDEYGDENEEDKAEEVKKNGEDDDEEEDEVDDEEHDTDYDGKSEETGNGSNLRPISNILEQKIQDAIKEIAEASIVNRISRSASSEIADIEGNEDVTPWSFKKQDMEAVVDDKNQALYETLPLTFTMSDTFPVGSAAGIESAEEKIDFPTFASLQKLDIGSNCDTENQELLDVFPLTYMEGEVSLIRSTPSVSDFIDEMRVARTVEPLESQQIYADAGNVCDSIPSSVQVEQLSLNVSPVGIELTQNGISDETISSVQSQDMNLNSDENIQDKFEPDLLSNTDSAFPIYIASDAVKNPDCGLRDERNVAPIQKSDIAGEFIENNQDELDAFTMLGTERLITMEEASASAINADQLINADKLDQADTFTSGQESNINGFFSNKEHDVFGTLPLAPTDSNIIDGSSFGIDNLDLGMREDRTIASLSNQNFHTAYNEKKEDEVGDASYANTGIEIPIDVSFVGVVNPSVEIKYDTPVPLLEKRHIDDACAQKNEVGVESFPSSMRDSSDVSQDMPSGRIMKTEVQVREVTTNALVKKRDANMGLCGDLDAMDRSESSVDPLLTGGEGQEKGAVSSGYNDALVLNNEELSYTPEESNIDVYSSVSAIQGSIIDVNDGKDDEALVENNEESFGKHSVAFADSEISLSGCNSGGKNQYKDKQDGDANESDDEEDHICSFQEKDKDPFGYISAPSAKNKLMKSIFVPDMKIQDTYTQGEVLDQTHYAQNNSPKLAKKNEEQFKEFPGSSADNKVGLPASIYCENNKYYDEVERTGEPDVLPVDAIDSADMKVEDFGKPSASLTENRNFQSELLSNGQNDDIVEKCNLIDKVVKRYDSNRAIDKEKEESLEDVSDYPVDSQTFRLALNSFGTNEDNVGERESDEANYDEYEDEGEPVRSIQESPMHMHNYPIASFSGAKNQDMVNKEGMEVDNEDGNVAAGVESKEDALGLNMENTMNQWKPLSGVVDNDILLHDGETDGHYRNRDNTAAIADNSEDSLLLQGTANCASSKCKPCCQSTAPSCIFCGSLKLKVGATIPAMKKRNIGTGPANDNKEKGGDLYYHARGNTITMPLPYSLKDQAEDGKLRNVQYASSAGEQEKNGGVEEEPNADRSEQGNCNAAVDVAYAPEAVERDEEKQEESAGDGEAVEAVHQNSDDTTIEQNDDDKKRDIKDKDEKDITVDVNQNAGSTLDGTAVTGSNVVGQLEENQWLNDEKDDNVDAVSRQIEVPLIVSDAARQDTENELEEGGKYAD